MDAYNVDPMLLFLLLIGLVDTGLKGWAMWRAARMNKLWWFIPLLILNSFGLLPLLFILMTRDEYAHLITTKANTTVRH